MSHTIAILGGGVAGLSAAHELVQRGFQVSVYERKGDFGGKARSVSGQPVGGAGLGDLPYPVQHVVGVPRRHRAAPARARAGRRR